MSGKQTAEAQITIDNLTMAYGDFVVMRDLNFTINRGDIFIIMGGSGCGKSTLMRHMIGLKSPAKGRVLYDGASFWDASPAEKEQIQRRFGVLYQSGALWSSMTLAENVALPLQQLTQLDAVEIQRQVSLKLSLVGFGGFEEFYPSEISGGMCKRAGLARAMALDPEVLFFDEPSAGLDPVSAKRLDDLILQLRDSLGVRGVLEALEEIGVSAAFRDEVGFGDIETVLLLVVNARSDPRTDWDRRESPPGFFSQLLQASNVPIDRYSFDTIELMLDLVEISSWRRELKIAQTRLAGATKAQAQASIPKLDMHVLDISFDMIRDPEERAYFMNLPTSFVLPAEAVGRLREIAGRVMRESVEYQSLLRAVDGRRMDY